MKPYKIVVAYDGTAYHGWQEQKQLKTVAGVLQATFKKVFGHEIKAVGASRTDTGVHAHHQVARFYTDRLVDNQKMLRSWNGALPYDISLLSLEESPEGFHPQHTIAKKIYRYYFSLDRPLPFVARYVYYYSYPVDHDLLQKSLACFVGTHDFSAFCTDSCNKNTVCTIDAITIEFDEQYQAYCIEVTGKRFLHHMVRRIVGAALKVSSFKRCSVQMITAALESGVSNSSLPKAPACGLHLQAIYYQD